MINFKEFKKIGSIDNTEKLLCQFTDAELIEELRNREGTRITTVNYGETFKTSYNGPRLVLQIFIDTTDSEDE